MTHSLHAKKQKIVSVLIYALIGVFVCVKGAIYYPDSYAFLEGYFNRSPLYVTFLKGITAIFGDAFELPLILIQYLFVIGATSTLMKTIREHFAPSLMVYTLVLLMLIAPCVHLHFVANKILSEALAYPLVLLVFSCLFNALAKLDLKYVKLTFPLLIVLMLTRGQFLVFIPVVLLVVAYVFFKNRKGKQAIQTTLIMLLIPFLTSFGEKAYNKMMFGYYVNNAMNYVHLFSANIFVSDAEDVKLFKNEEQKVYYNTIYKSLEEAQLTKNLAIANGKDEQRVFENNFSSINNVRVHELGLSLYEAKGYNLYEQNIKLNELCKQMYMPLLKDNLKSRILLLYKNFKTTFGGAKHVILMFVLLVFGVVFTLKYNDPLFKFIALGTLLLFANNSIIAIAVHPIKRYFFYFDWLLFAIIVLMLDYTIKHKKQWK